LLAATGPICRDYLSPRVAMGQAKSQSRGAN